MEKPVVTTEIVTASIRAEYSARWPSSVPSKDQIDNLLHVIEVLTPETPASTGEANGWISRASSATDDLADNPIALEISDSNFPAPASVPQAETPKCETCDSKGVVLDKETQLVVDCPECDNPDLERQGDTATAEELGRGIVCFPCQTENICKAFKRCQTLRDLAAQAEPKGEHNV